MHALLPLFLSALSVGRLVLAVDVSVSSTAPDAAKTLHPALVSFSLEQDRWTDWTGTTSTNQFWLNTLRNLQDLTGVPPHIRIGANTEDRTTWDPNVQYSTATYPAYSANVAYPEATKVVVGDGYYQLSSRLLPGTHVTWGLNLGANNLTNAYLMAKSIIKAFNSAAVKNKGIVLDFLEIGNEADLYKNNGLRSSSYSAANFVSEWTAIATNITAAFHLERTNTRWLGASFAGTSHSTSSFSPQAIFANGILDTTPGSLITTISQHRYSGSFCTGNGALLQELMRKSNVRGNLTDLIPDITASRSRGLDYIGGEMNSLACHGAPGVSDTAGAALWTLDYTLFAASIGISQVFFHEGIGFKYNLIQPVALDRSIRDGTPLPTPLAPHVQPQYYGGIIVNELIGTSGSAEVAELVINDPYISGYAAYEDGELVRVVLIHSRAWLKESVGTRERGKTRVVLQGTGASDATARRLKIGYADDAQGLTWGGVSYETADGRPGGSVVSEQVDLAVGVQLQETEVVLLEFQ